MYHIVMNYYDEILKKIEELLKDNKQDEVRRIVDDELSQAYIPRDFEEKLNEIKDSLAVDIKTHSLSDEEIIEYLGGSKEKQLMAVSILDKKNLREYVDICNDYLSHEGFKNAKALLLDSLIRQELNDTIYYNDEGMEYEFIPKYQLPIEESDGFLAGNKYLEEYYLKDPSKLMLTLPITLEESEGLYVAKDICEYIEEAFNRDVCIKKEDLN